MTRSTLGRVGVASLAATIPLGIVLWPLLLVFSIVPFIGFIVRGSSAEAEARNESDLKAQALPTLLSLSIFLLYATAWTLYLLFEYDGRLPLNPVRCWRVDTALWRVVRDAWRLSIFELGLDLAYRRLMITGGRDAKSTVVEGIVYGAPSGARRLDLYLPAAHFVDDRAAPPAPIIVVAPGGGWMLRKRALYTQLALRLRQLGYAVVVPDLVAFPDGKGMDMVVDLRAVLEWTARHAVEHRLDPEQIYLLGHGSGAHLALLTIVQEAVVRSRDDYVLTQYEGALAKGGKTTELTELPAGVRRLEIAGENIEIPDIRGMILLGGIADVIKLVRYESRRGVEQISPLRRALGPSHASCLMASPSHLLYGAKQVLDPTRLPDRILLLHGGADVEVPISQSVLLKSLFVGAGVRNVRLRAYRELSHLEALTSLMRPPRATKYGQMMLSEIAGLISGADDTPRTAAAEL